MLTHAVGHQADLAAWRSAVEHLTALGLPAAVPELVGARLRRAGISVDWTYSGGWAA